MHAFILACGSAVAVRADEDKKSDKDIKVAAGTKFKLTVAEIVLAEKPNASGELASFRVG